MLPLVMLTLAGMNIMQGRRISGSGLSPLKNASYRTKSLNKLNLNKTTLSC